MCKFCGQCRDQYGFHDLSCTCGGDNTERHDAVAEIIHHWAGRARINPEMEKAGLLADPALFVELRRPADVLIDDLIGDQAEGNPRDRPASKTALDIKVINALGADHRDATIEGPVKALSVYRRKALATNSTERLCADQGITYEPLVFSVQGGIEPRAEAILSMIAKQVALEEGADVANIKSMILEDIAFTLVRKGARAISRRQARTYTHSGGLSLSVDMADSDSEDEVGEGGHTDGGIGTVMSSWVAAHNHSRGGGVALGGRHTLTAAQQ
jgi:hypothetical protein